MDKALDSLFDIKLPEDLYNEEELRIKSNLDMLRKTLNNHQKKLLLRVIDDKEIIQEKTAQDFYKKGFQEATKLMIDCLYQK